MFCSFLWCATHGDYLGGESPLWGTYRPTTKEKQSFYREETAKWLLSNIMLNELDKELEARGLRFVRYTDDSLLSEVKKRQTES